MWSIEDVRMDAGARLLDHRHPEVHWLLVVEGEVREDGAIYRQGHIRVSSPDDRHFLRFDRQARCLIVAGDLPGPTTAARRVFSLPRLVAEAAQARSAEDVMRIVTASEAVDAVQARVPSWLSEFERARHAGRLSARGIGAVARQAGVSREHLARSYRRCFGTSVTDAIKAARLHRAWDAITGSVDTLALIADAHGYADQSHMTRHFAEWMALTPAQVRRTAVEVTRLQDGTLALDV